MLRLVVPDREFFNESTQEFINVKGQTLQLEHSLISLSKWESKWNKPFLSKEDKTREETLDYVRCMTLTQNVRPEVYQILTTKNLDAIRDYIDAPMTATTFGKEEGRGRSRRIVTAEVIYYWMITLNIPPEYAKWHLNRLITLIRVCNEENKPKKSMGQRQLARRNTSLNAARRKKHHSRG